MRTLLLFLLLSLPLFSCMREDVSDCPWNRPNTVLLFRYADEKGNDVFAERIESVEVYLFDENGHFLAHHPLTGTDLDQWPGIELRLDPGEYWVVCWANVLPESRMIPVRGEGIEEVRLLASDTRTGERWHYAPRLQGYGSDGGISRNTAGFRIDVPEAGTAHHTLDFMSAHRTVQVWEEGWDDPALDVELTAVPAGYDFFLTTARERHPYRAEARLSETEGYAAFATPFFAIDPAIEVNLYGPDQSLAYTLNLGRYFADHRIEPSAWHDLQIRIRFLDGGVNVDITLPGWGGTGVNPIG